MRAGNLFNRVKFYAKVTSKDDFGASVDSWPTVTISTRGEVRWTGGNKALSTAEEKIYSRNMELTVRYRSNIVETMKVKLDESSDFYIITYMEVIGRKQALKLQLEKEN
ncbi:MAG TPA: head-tail adaptor protein [Bacteroidales bacterium]|nr:head-tail adaptor protein [Bacteroidales bacterium]